MSAPAENALNARRAELSNGLSLLHSEATSNASVVVRLIIKAGASRERPEDQGLASLVGRMLRQGTQTIAKDALAEELDGMGAGLSVDVGFALVAVSIKCLAEDFPRALEILGEVALRPTFPGAELEKLRGQVLTDLKEAEDSTRWVAERLFREMAYPPEHRYHRMSSGTPETVQRFSVDDLKAFHSTNYVSNQAHVVIVGDVSFEEAQAQVERVLGAWQPGHTVSVEETLPKTPPPAPTTRTVALSGKTQADIVQGTTTFERNHPDYYALAFANHIIGRIYFMGRLGEKVRDEQGLAYYATSDLGAGIGSGGWTVRSGVNPSNLDKALASIDAEIRRFLAEGPTEAEQADGIASLLGSLPRQLETNEGVAGVLGEIEMYGLGLDYLDRYPDIIRSLTRERVTEAARSWIDPDKLVTAIAGPPRD